MAYNSVLSLKQTIERRLLNSSDSLLPRSLETIGYAYRAVEFLEKVLKRSDDRSRSSSSNSRRVKAFDGQIREEATQLEDVLESHLSNLLITQSESLEDAIHFSIDLQNLEEDVYSFAEFVMKLKEELCKPLFEEEEDGEVFDSSSIGGKTVKMIGLSDEFHQMKDWLTRSSPSPFQVLSLVGMAGIGKTTFAKGIFEDPAILGCFDCCAWVRVGIKCQLNEIPRDILAQLNPNMDKVLKEGDEEIAQYIKESLGDRKCLIVLDDVWDNEVLHYLNRFLPNNKDGCRVLLTTRLQQVAEEAGEHILNLRLLNDEESWHLLRESLFVEDVCPYQLERAGMKIAEKCEGLPLMIVTVADLLSKAKKSLEYWEEMAGFRQVWGGRDALYMEAYDKIAKVIFPSYEYLPQHLRACFLFLGVFPQNHQIPRSVLINMWIAQGLLELDVFESSENRAVQYLQTLVSRSLVIVYERSAFCLRGTVNEIKTCGLQSSMWYLCKKEAGKSKFFHVLENYSNALEEGMKSHRQLCIHNNTLFSIKDVFNSMAANCPTSRYLLCYGPYHKYPLQICFDFRLLRLLDALTIRLYEFPLEVLNLAQLRYIALTCDGELPSSISELLNLQFLIIHRHQSVQYYRAPSYLPNGIWDMKELKHLHVMGSDLPDCCGALLLNLTTVLGVTTRSCTKSVFTGIPNLKKLGIQIDMVPHESFCCFDDISYLYRLESLKCVIVNPDLTSEVVAAPAPVSTFPSGLTKLSLTGLGYPWESMRVIASLPNLEVLKLRSYAFRGQEWEIEDNTFLELRFLIIEDSDLVQWKVGRGSFRNLIRLSIRRCYKLEELHWITSDGHVPEIDVVDCNVVELKKIH